MSRVLVVSTSTVDDHDTGRHHPEHAGRLAAVDHGIDRAAIERVMSIDPRPATRAELERVHSARDLDQLEQFVEGGGGALDADTVASRGSWATALRAAGSGLVAIEGLRAGAADAAFVAALSAWPPRAARPRHGVLPHQPRRGGRSVARRVG